MSDRTNIKLPDDVQFILSRIHGRGYRAHIVGGSVRDYAIGRTVGDFDITTDATPLEIKEIFSDLRTVDTGIKHGTVTVIYNSVPYEITTYRVDGEYGDNRHPNSVDFTGDLADDLARRDFTVNAMCYNSSEGFIDLYGGLSDIDNRLIRAVGEPKKRFREDALRILRALRFASVLDFDIEAETGSAIFGEAELMQNVSKERIYVELMKLIGGVGAYRILSDYRSVMLGIMPELSKLVLPSEERFLALDSMDRLLSLFILGSDNPISDFSDFMKRMRSDNVSRISGEKTIDILINCSIKTVSDALMIMHRYDYGVTERAIKLGVELSIMDRSCLSLLTQASHSGIPYKIRDLEIDGKMVKSLGYIGAEIGNALEYALESVMLGVCKNTPDELIRLLTEYRK